MKRIVAVSTGLVYRLISDKNEQIAALEPFVDSGIEIMLNFPEAALQFEPTTANMKFLRALDLVTIHAPSCSGMIYKNDEPTKLLLTKLEQLYNRLNAKNITFHYDQIENWDIFENLSCQISIENSDRRKPNGQTPAEIKLALEKYSRFRFTFDFAHALDIDQSQIPEFFALKNYISEMHVSVMDNEVKEHRFLFEKPPLKKYLEEACVDLPFVTEAVAMSEGEIPKISDEINFLQS